MFKNKAQKNINWQAWVMGGFLASIFALLYWFDILTWQAPLAFLISFVFFILFRDHLWKFLVLAAPTIAFGQIIQIELRPNWIYEMSITEAILLLVLSVFVIEYLVERRFEHVKIDLLFLLGIGFVAWALSTYSKTMNFHNYVGQARVLVFSLIAYFLAYNLFDDLKKIRLFFAGLSVAVLAIAIELFWKLSQVGFSMSFFLDRSSIVVPVGALALASSMIAMLLPIVLVLGFMSEQKKQQTYYFGVFAIGWLAVFMSLGKAAIGSLLIGLFVIFLRFRKQRLVMSLSLYLFAVLAFVFMAPYLSGLANRVLTVFTDQNVSFRVGEYQIAQKIINEHWQLGVGLGQEPLYYARQYPFEYNELVNNYWLQIILDLGVVGLSLAVIGFSYILFKNYQLLKSVRGKENIDTWLTYGLAATTVVVAINGLAEVTVFALNYALVMWLFVGAGMAYTKLK